jgi:hypothetical protein
MKAEQARKARETEEAATAGYRDNNDEGMEVDHVAEGDFYMKGGIDEVLAAAGSKK